MSLSDQLNARLADIDARITSIKDRARAEVASLLQQRAILVQAGALLTPDIENAFAALQQVGIFRV